MNEILKTLYEGELFPSEDIKPKSEDYKIAKDKRIKLVERLQNKLSDKDAKILEEILENVHRENYCFCVDSFVSGFRYGARMIIEVYVKENDK